MSISVQIYSNANSASRSVTFDFAGDILAPVDISANTSCNAFYFKATSTGTQDNNIVMPVKIIRSLSDLALFKYGSTATRRQSASNTSNAYGDIKSMVIDYTYDFVSGHTADQFTSGCALQRPMKFR